MVLAIMLRLVAYFALLFRGEFRLESIECTVLKDRNISITFISMAHLFRYKQLPNMPDEHLPAGREGAERHLLQHFAVVGRSPYPHCLLW